MKEVIINTKLNWWNNY